MATHFKKGLAIGEKGTASDLTFVKKGTVSVTVAALAAAAEADVDVTISGAKVGDIIVVNPPEDAAETGLCVAAAWISAANTLTIRMSNQQASTALTGSTKDWPYLLISDAEQAF